jgi:hypothetical protein
MLTRHRTSELCGARRSFFIAALGLLNCPYAQSSSESKRHPKPPEPESGPGFRPKDGFVPNEHTAVRIAEAVLIPIYGEKEVRSERPFKAVLANGVWTVRGTLPPNFMGGTAVVRMAKSDGRIFFMIHGA